MFREPYYIDEAKVFLFESRAASLALSKARQLNDNPLTQGKATVEADRRAEPSPHHAPENLSDHIALVATKAMRLMADTFFAKRYGHRAVVLETVAGVPGMVAATIQHLSCLRQMKDDRGWIRTLLDEAENERMHLMTFVQIAKPSYLERLIIEIIQAIFYTGFFLLYLISAKTAHRLVGYFEEEAVTSYTQYLTEIDEGRAANVPAPQIAVDYWGLSQDATLRDVVERVRADEAHHRDTNHGFAADLLVDAQAV